MRSLGLHFDFSNPEQLMDDEWIQIEDTVGDWLILHGLDEQYDPTPTGELCESILDKLP